MHHNCPSTSLPRGFCYAIPPGLLSGQYLRKSTRGKKKERAICSLFFFKVDLSYIPSHCDGYGIVYALIFLSTLPSFRLAPWQGDQGAFPFPLCTFHICHGILCAVLHSYGNSGYLLSSPSSLTSPLYSFIQSSSLMVTSQSQLFFRWKTAGRSFFPESLLDWSMAS